MYDLGTRPSKHSLTLQGHRTSVTLEDSFWNEFKRIAEDRGQAINALATQIDAARGDIGLATAIRVFVLNELRSTREDT